MAKRALALDPADGLIVGEVGPWAIEKHDRLRKYIDASSGARADYLPPHGAGASYIELYSGAGRSIIRDTGTIIDGSALVAYKAALASGARFSDLHLSDLDVGNRDALAHRIKVVGGAANSYVGPADITVDAVTEAINPYGLHLAFLDPFGLGQLPFAIIKKMLRFRRMDMIIHVILSDLQRNLDDYSRIADPTLDNFAPGWRGTIDTKQAMAPLRAALIQYWLGLIRSLGTHPSTGIPLVDPSPYSVFP
jgi:three-Cys-motif partner protein